MIRILEKLRLIRSHAAAQATARQKIFTKARQTRSRGIPPTSGSIRGETVQKVDRREAATKRERKKGKPRRRRSNARGERSSSAWRELELDLVLLVLARPFVHPRPCRARAAPRGRTIVRGEICVWTGRGKKDGGADSARFATGEPLTSDKEYHASLPRAFHEFAAAKVRTHRDKVNEVSDGISRGLSFA